MQEASPEGGDADRKRRKRHRQTRITPNLPGVSSRESQADTNDCGVLPLSSAPMVAVGTERRDYLDYLYCLTNMKKIIICH